MASYEGLRLKLLRLRRIGLANYRKKQLNNTDFTIISNNCWGGMTYESYNIPKISPTVGLFFMADDYIKFVYDIEGYVNGELTFISTDESKWRNDPLFKNNPRFGTYPIGAISNGKESIELFFLHYHSETEAYEKWNRRCKRINWDKMIIKFNNQNGCTSEHIDQFAKLEMKNKLFFSNSKKRICAENGVFSTKNMVIKQYVCKEFITASHEPFGRKITNFINNIYK